MILSDRTLTVLAIVAVGLSALALLLALAAASRRRAADPGGPIALDPALRGILDGHGRELREIEKAVRSLHGADARQADQIAASVRRVALLRYDAFEDVGGRLSFSCALLDDHGTGVVLTSINGRQETRVYAKPVAEGASRYNLSQEEDEAIRQAMADRAVEAR